jgi:two-component system, cell cycle sensor histidine kinase and response regulator CckA
MNTPTRPRNSRILVIDDNPSIHDVIRTILSRNRPEPPPPEGRDAVFHVDTALQGEEGLRMVQAAAEARLPYAMAFIDVRMPPGWDGVETTLRIWKQFPDLQVVLCTGYADGCWDQRLRQMGRPDSLVVLMKPFDTIEVLQLADALTQKWSLHQELNQRLNNLDSLAAQRTLQLQAANEKLKQEISRRRQSERALVRSEERFSKAFKASPIPLAILSLPEEKFLEVNQGFLAITGYDRDELIGHHPAQLNLWDDPQWGSAMVAKVRQEISVSNLQSRIRAKSGRVIDALFSVELLDKDADPSLLMIARDVTEEIHLQNQLQQARKMEAVGQLAAGVAHDFNNILLVVQGNASLLLDSQPPESEEAKPLRNVCAAAERASRLVRQLLTFSRQQALELRPLNLGETLATVSEMLPRILTESVRLTLHAPPSLPNVRADAAMLETLLMNLASNARDAMPDGGQLNITAETVELSPADAASNPDARPGQFIRLAVSDTGNGIEPDILPRIFDPFFTTKPVGKGTGLGLATVYAIAKQHHGWVDVCSQVGKGTSVSVLLPILATSPPPPDAEPPPPKAVKGGRETILVVEDEPDLRDLVAQVLKSRDYRVITAASGAKALETWAQREGDIHLLLTDMVMPDGLTGRKLAERLMEEDPHLRVIFTSGYTAGIPGTDLENVAEGNFLAKPYRPATLLQVVRDCLDRPTSRTVAAA